MSDGEVIGLDNDGRIICYNAETGHSYNSGEAIDEFGLDNLTQRELETILKLRNGNEDSN